MENKQKKDPDEVIALAICLYEADGYPENSFEMLDYVMSHKYCQKASRLMDDGYTRAKQVDERQNMKHDLVVYGVAIQDGEGNRIDPKDFYKADERQELDVDAVEKVIAMETGLNVPQIQHLAQAIVNTFKK